MRNARRSNAGSRSVRFSKHQTHTVLDGECAKSGNLRGVGASSSVCGTYFANAQYKTPHRRIRRYSRSQTLSRRIRSRWIKLPRPHWRARGRTRRFEGPILRMRNARQSGAASGSAQFFTHQVSICSRGGHIYISYLGGPVATSPFRGPICQNAQCKAPHRRIRRSSSSQT
jgi:hypothetical protein